MTILGLIDIVEKINDEIVQQQWDEKSPDRYIPQVDVCTTGNMTWIKWLDLTIWNSEDDEREWVNDDEREPIEPFLRKKIMEAVNTVSKIKI